MITSEVGEFMNNKLDTDINYIIQMSLKGDKKYQEILLNKLKPLIYKNIYLYWNYKDTVVEDLLQEGYIVILDALKSFDKNKEVHFLAYIKSKLKYFYMNYYRNHVKYTNCLTHSSNFEEIDKRILESEENTLLMNCINKLSDREQKIIYSYYFDEISLNEISKNLNITYRAAINRKYRIIKKLKKCVTRR